MGQKEIVQSLIRSHYSLEIVISLNAEPRKDFFSYNMHRQVALEVVLWAGRRRHKLYNMQFKIMAFEKQKLI